MHSGLRPGDNLRVGEFLGSRSMLGRVARMADSKRSQHGARPALHSEHRRAREDPGKPVGGEGRHRSKHASVRMPPPTRNIAAVPTTDRVRIRYGAIARIARPSHRLAPSGNRER